MSTTLNGIDVSYNSVTNGKRTLGKLLTQWKNGKVSMRQIDSALGYPQWGGKKIESLWINKLGKMPLVDDGERLVVSLDD